MIALLLAIAAAAPDVGMAPVYTKDSWPTALVDRPLVLPHATFELAPGFVLGSNQFGTLAIGLGIADRVEIDAAGVFCANGDSCQGTQQAVGALIGVALVERRNVNLVVAASYSYEHLRDVDYSGPGISLELAVRAGPRFQLVMSAGATYTDDSYYARSFAGINAGLELRFQIGPHFAVGPFIAPEALKLESPSRYAIPAGIRALISPRARFDIGLAIEDTDLSGSSTIANASAAASLYVAVRL